MTTIPAIKLNPKDIYPVLDIMQNYNYDRDLTKNKIHEYLLSVAPTGSITYRNAVYALSFHTLRCLKLIVGKGKKLRLSNDGKLLIKFHDGEGNESYYKELARIVIRIDRENANVIGRINDLNKEIFTKRELIKKLLEHGVQDPQEGGKLSKWMRLLKFLRFIDELDVKNTYKHNKYQYLAAEIKYEKITLDNFYIVSLKSYKKLSKIKRGSPYIPIPELEDDVCSSLIEKGFTTPYFRKYLLALTKSQKKYPIYFGKPGARESNGLRIKGIYFYYIAIFEVNDDVF